jgi:ubiquinone/menaquinone biosynthesis C-methylase UbiE
MDNFGFKTQGINYDAFRPKYPASLFLNTLNKLPKKNKYLDVAMGTGQLLFVIS